MKTIGKCGLLLAGSLMAGLVWADETMSTAVEGSRTQAWLDMQRNGQVATRNPQTISPVEYDKSLERFLKTYDYQIPQKLSKGENFKTN